MIWQTANNIATQALENNSLQPIASQLVTTYAHGVQFTYHLRNEFAEKKPHQTTQTNNPFLPHEPAMFVAQCGLQHKVLLNKYPVIQPHLLALILRASPLLKHCPSLRICKSVLPYCLV